MKYAINQLEITLDVLKTNAPINEKEGRLEQAELERAGADDIVKALHVLRAIEEAKHIRIAV